MPPSFVTLHQLRKSSSLLWAIRFRACLMMSAPEIIAMAPISTNRRAISPDAIKGLPLLEPTVISANTKSFSSILVTPLRGVLGEFDAFQIP